MVGTARVTAMVAVLVVALAACGGDGSDLEPSPLPTTTEPAVTAPPTLTPEEQAEADIQATFEELIAARDAYYANASDYALEEVATNSPATEWNVTGQAELEMSNWTVLWRQGELEQVGDSRVALHEMVDLSDSSASSRACLEMSSLSYQNFDGTPAELTYQPDESQLWEMEWVRYEEADVAAGIAEPGWYVRRLSLTRNEPC